MDHNKDLTPEKTYQSTIEERFASEMANADGEIVFGFTNDYMFRAVLQKNMRVLKGILAAVLERKPEEIHSCEIKNPIVLGESAGDKTCILDIKVNLNGNANVNLEMQMGNLGNWSKRSVYYLCSMYTDLKKGEDYNSAIPCTHIGFLNQSPFPEYHEFISKYYLTDRISGHVYSDDISLITVDLSLAFEKSGEREDPVIEKEENVRKKRENKELRQWARLMCARDWKEAITLAKESETMKEAVLTLHELSEDEKIKLQCQARMFYQGDMRGAKMEGIKEGIIQGEKQGIKQGKKQGIQSINRLNQCLSRDGRTDDILKAASDEEYQEKLLKEYGLWEADE